MIPARISRRPATLILGFAIHRLVHETVLRVNNEMAIVNVLIMSRHAILAKERSTLSILPAFTTSSILDLRYSEGCLSLI